MRAARIVMALACAVVVVMFWTNDDNAGQPSAERGRGQYLPILDRGDGHMLYLMARSTALDLDWQFDNDLLAFGDPWNQAYNPITRRKEIPHPIGPALIWTPLIWVARAGAAVANLAGADIPLHGYSEWYQRFVFLSSVAAALLAVLLGRKIAHRFIGGAWSPTYAAVAVLLGTAITYYATNMPSYGHALDAGVCGAFLGVWALTLGRTRWSEAGERRRAGFDARRWVSLGALLGLAMLIRVQDVAFGVVVALEVVVAVIAELRTREGAWRQRALTCVGGGALVLGVAIVVFIPQLVYWDVIYGDWRALPQGARYTRLGSPMVVELLYSARNGWFSTTPIAYLAVIGLACLPRKAWLVGGGLALALAIQVYLNSTIFDWWGMASFSQRRLCSVTLVLVVGLAALLWRCGQLAARLRRMPRAVWHVPAIAILGSMVVWNLWRVNALAGGKGAPAEVVPTCCDHTPKWARRELSWIYRRIGNPFQLPASWWFARKHEVDITRWDQAVGYYALMPSAASLRDDTMYAERGGWRIGYPKSEPYLMGYWSGPRSAFDKYFRWTLSPRVRALVPNLMPHAQQFTLWLAPGGSRFVRIWWDDTIVVERELVPGWQPVVWQVHDMPVGEHELVIDAFPLPLHAPPGFPQPRLPVGVAVNNLEVTFVAP